MLKLRLGALASVAFMLAAGCSSGSALPQRHSNKLTATACSVVDSTAPNIANSPFQTWDEGAPYGLPFEKVVVAVRKAPNAKLHSEVVPIESAVSHHFVHAAPDTFITNFTAMVRTCMKLGLSYPPART